MDPNSLAFVAPPELIQAISRCSMPVNCIEDRELFHRGDNPVGLYILQSGRATMALEGASAERMFRVPVAPESLLGLPALSGDEPYFMTAVAHAGAVLGFVTRDVFSRLMLSEPKLALMIVQMLAAEVRSARGALSAFVL